MERMPGVDAGFLYMETPTVHMHTLKVAVLDPPEAFEFGKFTQEFLARLDRLPPFRRRAVPVPFGLNHPMWVTDRDIDPARHLFGHQVAPPGGMAQLDELIGTIAGVPLDRSIPLWELHVCEGLAEGRVAVVAKIHHALADGLAANALLLNVVDGVTPATTRWRPEPTPSRGRLLRDAVSDAVRQLPALPVLLWRTLLAVLAVVRHKRESRVKTPLPIVATPRVSFNGPLTSRRLFATCSLPLADLKAVRQGQDVSLNDVVLAVVGGAFRRWLDGRGERPAASLIAGVPVGTDPRDAPPRLSGNRVSNLFTTLATDRDDPRDRLHEISRTTTEAKVVQRTLGPDMLADWVQFTPPGPFSLAMRAYSRLRAARLHPAPFNVIVSNVPGPAEPVTIAGARLADLYSVGPILEGIGLNVTAWSYIDRMNFSLVTCPELVADLRPLVDAFRPALDELLALGDQHQAQIVG